MTITKKMLDEVAVSDKEYALIIERLGREPNPVELGMIGSLWSEHCGYKHSKLLLKTFPNISQRMLVKPGEENAGVVDIGNGLAIAMKIESHNHPSAVEPYQGAATGVGGIVRDIFTMGARPIALLNSLRFGPLTSARNRYLFHGVVGGISGYGNCIGIPNVGGEIYFAQSYAGNPLVNAMCVGLVEHKKLIRARTGGAGNIIMIVGSDTGRDGIHGASGLASRTFEDERELRPTVQVGNPFLEKVLIEACIELAETDHILGMQDLGAAGLTSASIETASHGGNGVIVDVAKVPRREDGMNPYEIMLSESQERMLVIVKPGHEADVEAIFEKWDLKYSVIGKTTDDGIARIYDGDKLAAELPVQLLTEPPLYRFNGVEPSWQKMAQAFEIANLPLPSDTPASILLKLLSSPNIASKEAVFRQYDHQVQTNTVIAPGGDGALLRIKGTSKGIALATDGNGRISYLDPFVGGAIAVAEACRNVACTGALPIAITNCLNFGNPERLDVYYQLEQAIRGMSEACKAFNVPVISGNVSLYNESRGEPIYPTPVVGALGLTEDISHHCTAGFKKDGNAVVLLGSDHLSSGPASLAGSEYLELVHGKVVGRPQIDLKLEAGLQNACRRAIEQGLLSSAHDCSDGGLAVALAECCIMGGKGFVSDLPVPARWDYAMFGEDQSRIVVSLPANNLIRLKAIAKEEGVPWLQLGTVKGSTLSWKPLDEMAVTSLSNAWNTGLPNALQG